MVQMLTERYRERLVGVLSCYDRIVITGRGKCLHYYFYFIDAHARPVLPPRADLGPFRLQFYFNGHNLLAHKLDREGIGYRMIDNAFVAIDDWERAQALARRFTSRPCTTSSINWHARIAP